MFVNDSQKISKDKMRMLSTNMSKPEKPPENAFNHQAKRSSKSNQSVFVSLN